MIRPVHRRAVTSAFVLLVVACARPGSSEERGQAPAPAVSQQPASPTRLVAGRVMRGGPPIRLQRFVARVPAVTGEGSCRVRELSMFGQPRKLVSYTIGAGEQRRQATVFFDMDGKRVQYQELRGNLSVDSVDPVTDISLDFVRGTAQASNQWGSRIEVANGTLSEGIRAANLGVPEQMIQLVEQRCLTETPGHPGARDARS